MSRRAAAAPVNYTIDQEAPSDSDLDSRSPSKAQPKPTTKRNRAASTTKTASSASTKTRSSKPRAAPPKPRTAIKEIPATQAADESADEFDNPGADERAMSTPMTATKTRADAAAPVDTVPAKAASEGAAKPKGKRGRKAKEIKTEVPDTHVEDAEGEAHASSNFGKSAAVKQPRPGRREVVPATQVNEVMDVDVDGDGGLGGVVEKVKGKGKAETKAAGRKRTSTGVEDERSSDGSAKKRMSDMSKRFEALEVRYDQLKDVGVREAEKNYDALKKSTDERQKAAENLASHLRTELAVQSSAAAEAGDLRSKAENLDALTEKLKGENKTLEANLKSAQAEMKALHARLAATRAGSEQKAGPGTVKNGVGGKQMPGNAGAGAVAQKMAVKEQLYGDLTGLIIRDVKRMEDEDGSMDVYDCIQTGKNGTLRFHLSVPNPQPSGVPYGDADLEYAPLLDPSNDRTLMELLPDYLTEEIMFPQREAQRFYGRINEFIMKSRPAQQPDADAVEQDGDAEGGEEAL